MKQLIFFLLLSWVLLFQAPLQAENALEGIDLIEIKVMAHPQVIGRNYRLGEIAQLDGFDVDLISQLAELKVGLSPRPGKSLPLSKGLLNSKLRKILAPNQYRLHLPKNTKVTRAYNLIPAQEVADKLKAEIQKGYPNYDQVKIEIKSQIKDQAVPQGKTAFSFERVGKTDQIGGWSSWKVKILSKGKEFKQMIVRAKVEVVSQVVVAKSPIKKGKTIAKEDLIMVPKDISRERKGFKPTSDLIVGQQAKRDILQMETLKPSLVEEPVIVIKGAPLRIVYQSASLRFTNLGVAMKAARKGEMIPIRTLQNKTTIYAVVKDSKTAEVAL